MGTYGYAAPEYVATGKSRTNTTANVVLISRDKCNRRGIVYQSIYYAGHLYVKSDVYGFGVVLLEMLTGMRALDTGRPAPQHSLVEWAKPYLADRRKLARLVDPRLEGQYPSRAAQQAAQLTLRCLSGDPRSRPSMAEVVQALVEIERIRSRPKAASSREDASPRVPTRRGGHGHHHHHHSSRPRSGSDGARSGYPSPRVR